MEFEFYSEHKEKLLEALKQEIDGWDLQFEITLAAALIFK